MRMKNVCGLILSLASMIMLSGCGGGGAGAGGTVAVVRVATSGTLPTDTVIGAIQASVVASPATGLSLDSGNVAATGSGAGSTLQANTNAVTGVVLGLLSANGIQTGEFATLYYHFTAGNAPAAGNFSIADGATIVDINGTAIPGITAVIESVTIQ